MNEPFFFFKENNIPPYPWIELKLLALAESTVDFNRAAKPRIGPSDIASWSTSQKVDRKMLRENKRIDSTFWFSEYQMTLEWDRRPAKDSPVLSKWNPELFPQEMKNQPRVRLIKRAASRIGSIEVTYFERKWLDSPINSIVEEINIASPKVNFRQEIFWQESFTIQRKVNGKKCF